VNHDKSSDTASAPAGADSPGSKLRVKSLKLSKEALRTLSGTEMRTVAGGLGERPETIGCITQFCYTWLVCPIKL